MRSLILILLLVCAAHPQVHPNFTGTWKQDNSKSTIWPGSTIQYSNRIDQQEQRLSVTTILGPNGDRKESTYTRDYVIGGQPKITTDRKSGQFTNIVRREGDSLVFEAVEKEKSA